MAAPRKTAVTGGARPQTWPARPCSGCSALITAAPDALRVQSIYWLATGARRQSWRWLHRRCA